MTAPTITEKQKELVTTTFGLVAPIAETAADIFYTRLFEIAHEVKPLFKGDIKKQGQMLMSMIGSAVNGLKAPEKLIPVVQNLGVRHAGYGVTPEHYKIVASALLYTLEKGLGEAWNDEVKDAWVAVYALLAGVMIEAAE